VRFVRFVSFVCFVAWHSCLWRSWFFVFFVFSWLHFVVRRSADERDDQGLAFDDERLVPELFFTVRSKNSSTRFQASRKTMSRLKK
jgi:hypothetical protein